MSALIGAAVTGSVGLAVLATQFEQRWLGPAAGVSWVLTAAVGLWWRVRAASRTTAAPKALPGTLRAAVADASAEATNIAKEAWSRAGRPAATEPAPAPPSPRHVDLDVLARLVGDDAALLAQFSADFLHQGQSLVNAIGAADAADDLSAAAAEAHKLKSLARSMGARPLADLCGQIERAVQPAEAGKSRTLTAALRTEWAQITDELRTMPLSPPASALPASTAPRGEPAAEAWS